MIRIAETKYGRIEGLPAADPRITAFKGIPFAAPPVGENRWRAPQPLQPWEGTYKAYDYGPISVQDTPGLGTDIYCREWHVDPEIPMSEDCLYLNVWTNAKKTDDKLPVLVWIHGGAYQWGYTAEMEFDGERIARRGVVVVTVCYRLAVFGFLAHPQLSKEQPDAPANFGLLDQQAALRWVKENIAAFGGDPENITLAGQSAGGGSVLNQITSDTNAGDINRAVIMSGVFGSPYHEDEVIKPIALEKAEERGVDFFDFLGVKTLEEARQLDAVWIRDKYAEYAITKPRFMVTIDGALIQEDPMVRFAKGRGLNIPVMAGHTMDEFHDYIAFDADSPNQELIAISRIRLPKAPLVSEGEAVVRELKNLLGEMAEQVLTFPESIISDGVGFGGINVIESGVRSLFQTRQQYQNQPCYFYQFDVDIPGEDNPGTFHSVDLWFFFETLAKCSRPFVGRHYDVSRLMCNYFTNFIKNGNPNGVDADGMQMPEWAPYTKEAKKGVRFTGEGVKEFEVTDLFTDYMVDEIVCAKYR
ncbi:MAG: carboxylesterase family protein [Lachnospiraceae bacterium]|nr:carboxylesterase family protein [Lachnospiraceae bacterium]